MDQSGMKSTLAVVEQIWAFRQQKQSDKTIQIKINEEMKKSDFNEQQIKDTFINAQTVLKKGTAESDKQRMKPFQQSQTSNMITDANTAESAAANELNDDNLYEFCSYTFTYSHTFSSPHYTQHISSTIINEQWLIIYQVSEPTTVQQQS